MKRKILKYIGYFFAVMFLLLIIGYFLLKQPSVQNYLKQKILSELSKTYQAEWSIGDLYIDFFDEVTAQNILFLDQQNDTLLSADKLKVDIGLFSLVRQEIQLDEIYIENPKSKIYALSDSVMNFDFLIPPKNDEKTTSPQWAFDVKNVVLNSTSFSYKTSDIEVAYSSDLLKINADRFDLNNKIIHLGQVATKAGLVSIQKSSKSNQNVDANPESNDFQLPNLGWNFEIANLAFDHYDIEFISDSIRHDINDLILSVEDATYVDQDISGHIKKLSGTYSDFPQLDHLSGSFYLMKDVLQAEDVNINSDENTIESNAFSFNFNTQESNLDAFDVNISKSIIDRFNTYLPSQINWNEIKGVKMNGDGINYTADFIELNQIQINSDNLLRIEGDFSLKNFTNEQISIQSRFDQMDVILPRLGKVLPALTIPDSLRQYQNVKLSGNIEGSLSSLNVKGLALKIDQALEGNIEGEIRNLDNPEQLYLNVNLSEFYSEIEKLPIPKVESLALDSLGQVKFSGKVIGNLSALQVQGALATELGESIINGSIRLPEDVENMGYEGNLKLNRFELGTFLKNNEIKQVNLDLNFDGQGTTLANINTTVKGDISDFNYLGYPYQKIVIDAQLINQNLKGNVSIDDPNVKFNYAGAIDLDSTQNNFDFTLDIDTVNFKSLGLLEDALSLKMNVKTNFTIPLEKGDEGIIHIYGLKMVSENGQFSDDSIIIKAEKRLDSTFVKMNGNSIDLKMQGQFGIRDLIPAFKNQIELYLPKALKDTIQTEFVSKSVSIEGEIRTLQPLDLLQSDILIQAGVIHLDAAFDFENQVSKGKITADSLTYDSYFVEKLIGDFDLSGEKGFLNIHAANGNINTVKIASLQLDNEVNQGIITPKLIIKDEKATTMFKVDGSLDYLTEGVTFNLKDSLILNYQEWVPHEGNEIKYKDQELTANNFGFAQNGQRVTINSIESKPNNLKVQFKDFEVSQFQPFLAENASTIGGRLNGEIDLIDVMNQFYFLADVQVDQIVVDSTSVGTLTLNADVDPKQDVINADFKLKGKLNNVSGVGTYDIKTNAVKVDANVDRMLLVLLDPFLSEIIQESEGTIEGVASLTGTLDNPRIKGELSLNEVVTTIVPNNSRYRFEDHTISFDNEKIDLGRFKITDAKGNGAILDGKVYHKFLSDFRLDMKLLAERFTFLNTTSKENPVFNGKVILDANASLTGPPDLLDVNVTAKTLKETAIQISPFSGSDVIMEERFIAYGKPEDFEKESIDYLLKVGRQYPFKVNVNLEANQDAKLTFVLDPVSGDKIECRGNGDLKIVLNPDGRQEIYGTFTVNEGNYAFSYGDFVSKQFAIAPGGTIKFNGDPLKAELDIDAVYNVYTSVYELIKNEVSIDETEIEAAKKRTNVAVYLSLEGQIDEPELNLDIKVPDLESSSIVSSIERKLTELRNNPNELNNQVFGLLIFDSFIIGENATASFDNVGSNIALNSLSNLVSGQLNRLARNTIKGVDINVNVNSYESNYVNGGNGGNITELGVKVSKQLFNERLKVTAGGNFDLEGSTVGGTYSSFIGDFVLEYNLTRDGQYKVKVFSKSNYDRLLNENANRNGVSLYFNKTFDSKTDGK